MRRRGEGCDGHGIAGGGQADPLALDGARAYSTWGKASGVIVSGEALRFTPKTMNERDALDC